MVAEYDSPEGNGRIKGLMAKPAGATGTLPAVLVVHENRGLNPYIEDVVRRLAKAGYLAFGPDGLTPLGGYPGNDDQGREMQSQIDPAKLMADFFAAFEFLRGHEGSTGKVGAVGFCYGGGVCNALAVAYPDLAASVPFYGRQPAAEDVAKIEAPLLIHYAGLDERINAGWPDYETALKANGKAYTDLHLRQREPWLPQRHDAPLRRGGSGAGLVADAGVFRGEPELSGAARPAPPWGGRGRAGRARLRHWATRPRRPSGSVLFAGPEPATVRARSLSVWAGDMAGRLPKGVVALGFVSLFMDVSSEMIHGLLPLFLTGRLGASALVLGLIEGFSEAVAQVTKVFSGALSDRMGRRKPLALLGYGLAALTKPVFALAGSAGVVLAARAVDRLGKGIRGAPRDALVADLVEPERRGAAYGLRQTMDTIGAFAGPLIAIALMAASGGNFRLVFAVAILPAAIAVLILARGVEEPPQKAAPTPTRPRFDRASMAALGPAFWAVTVLGAVIGFARISEAFLILQANANGLAVALAPVVLVVMNVVYAATAWPVGILSDRVGRRGLLLLSLVVLAVSHGVLALSSGVGAALAGVALWGLHMGLSQGLLSAAVADSVPASLRGTGFGVFNLVGGLAVLLANTVAGGLWAFAGAPATFGVGAAAALLALILALRQGRGKPDSIHSHATKRLE